MTGWRKRQILECEMTDREAMAMALEALETLMIERGSIYEKAITALKERLAEHAMQEVQRLGQEIEQEPLAHWSDCAVHSEPAYPKSECDCGGIVAVADYTALSDKYVQVDSIQRLINRLNHAHHTDLCVRINGQDEWFQADWLKHMVIATPPQRTWVGLTNQERSECWDTIPEQAMKKVEAKLKDKNQ